MCKRMWRRIAPRCEGPQHPKDAVWDTAIVYTRDAARFTRQHWFDGSPFMVSEFIAHDLTDPYIPSRLRRFSVRALPTSNPLSGPHPSANDLKRQPRARPRTYRISRGSVGGDSSVQRRSGL